MCGLLLSTLLLVPMIGSADEHTGPVNEQSPARVRLTEQPPGWSDWRKVKTTEGIQARLTLEDRGTIDENGRRIANASAVLEVRNAGREARVAHFRLDELKLQIIDAAGKPVKKRQRPVRSRVFFPTGGSIPPRCYLGMPVGGVHFSSKRAAFVSWIYAWDLDPGSYTLKGTVEASVRHDHPKRETPWKKVTLELPPVEFVLSK